MKRLLLSLIFLVIVPLATQAEIERAHLYKVTYQGVESYLFGTIHLGVNLSEIPPKVIQALKNTEMAFFEIDLGYAKNVTANLREMNFAKMVDAYAMFSEPISRREIKLFRKFSESGLPTNLAEYLASDLLSDRTYTVSELMYLPSMYSNKFLLDAQLAVELNRVNGDDYLIRRIETDTVLNYVNQLEVSGQDEGTPIEEVEERTIEGWLKDLPDLFTYLDPVIQNYLNGQQKFESDFDFSGDDYDLAIRNAHWVMKVKSELKKQPTAIVVGVNHLYGSKGLIETFRRLGFKVEHVQLNR